MFVLYSAESKRAAAGADFMAKHYPNTSGNRRESAIPIEDDFHLSLESSGKKKKTE